VEKLLHKYVERTRDTKNGFAMRYEFICLSVKRLLCERTDIGYELMNFDLGMKHQCVPISTE
jgi:hypothetical protein